MQLKRRQFLNLFGLGTSALGIRSVLSGLPIDFLVQPQRALAAFEDKKKLDAASDAQFLLISSSETGDPVNCNVPGTYEDPTIYHPASPMFAATKFMLGDVTVTAAKTWTQLDVSTLSRTCFFHHATYSGIHTELPLVLKLGGFSSNRDSIVSAICDKTASGLSTIQTSPISFTQPALSYSGQPVSPIPPTSLAQVYNLYAMGPAQLLALRDSTLDQMHAWMKANGTPSQQNYIDQYARSQTDARQIPDQVHTVLSAISDNTVQKQVKAAIALFQMRITPAVLITVPFGGDNHIDPELAGEIGDYDGNNPATQGVGKTGVAALADMQQQLQSAGLTDQVTFCLLNLFGRTMGPNWTDGRGHNADHHTALLIGKHVRGSVIGGLDGTNTASAIDSGSGTASGGGDIPYSETFSAFGKTLVRACGVPQADADAMVTGGKTVPAALATP